MIFFSTSPLFILFYFICVWRYMDPSARICIVKIFQKIVYHLYPVCLAVLLPLPIFTLNSDKFLWLYFYIYTLLYFYRYLDLYLYFYFSAKFRCNHVYSLTMARPVAMSFYVLSILWFYALAKRCR